MIQKQRRPDMTASIKPLPDCSACSGSGLEQGVFGKRVCGVCQGAGMTSTTGDPLPIEEALMQLRLRHNKAREQLERGLMTRDQASEYYTGNRRGAGGSNYVGD